MSKGKETQQERIGVLLELVKENPELKIVPMVDGESGGDDYSYYMGRWGESKIDEVYLEDERIYFRSLDSDELGELIFERLWSGNKEWESEYVEKKTEEKMSEINWEKVIVVYIETA